MNFTDLPFSGVQPLQPGSSSSAVERLQEISARAASGKEMSDAEIKEVGQQFESMLLHQLLTAMRKSIPKNELFEESSASDIYKDMFDEKISEQVAASAQTGIGDAIAQGIKQQQERTSLASVTPHMISLQEGSASYKSLDQTGQTWRGIQRDQSIRGPISGKKRAYVPITNNEGTANKVNVAG